MGPSKEANRLAVSIQRGGPHFENEGATGYHFSSFGAGVLKALP
jgi:hypothetical protein